MRTEKIGGDHNIFPEGKETLRGILEAIAVASFEAARPAGKGWLHFDEGGTMSLEDASRYISGSHDGSLMLEMDYVQGRQVKTYIRQEGDHLVLRSYLFERDRGVPDPVFQRAREILAGGGSAALPTNMVSTKRQYRGESLDLRMKEFGYTRSSREDDWDFRKRVFPDLFQQSQDVALELLMGMSAAEWPELLKMLVVDLMLKDKLSRDDLNRFARGFAGDPQEILA